MSAASGYWVAALLLYITDVRKYWFSIRKVAISLVAPESMTLGSAEAVENSFSFASTQAAASFTSCATRLARIRPYQFDISPLTAARASVADSVLADRRSVGR